MTSRYLVRDLHEGKLNRDAALFVYCVGFETRSRFIAESNSQLARRTLAVVYDEGRTLSFSDNMTFAEKMRFQTVDIGAENFTEKLGREIAIAKANASLHVVVDVSSMNWAVMASVLVSVLDAMNNGDTLNVLYAPSEFKEPKLELLPIQKVGAPHPRVSGEIANPRKGRALLLGLGFEYGVSLNILDSQEPDISFIFRPNGLTNASPNALNRQILGLILANATTRLSTIISGRGGSLRRNVESCCIDEAWSLNPRYPARSKALKCDHDFCRLPASAERISSEIFACFLELSSRCNCSRNGCRFRDHESSVN